MGQLTVPGTSITYSNPNQLNAAVIDPQTNAVWQTSPFPAQGTIANRPNAPQLMGTGGPQPGSFDAASPTAQPIAVNKLPVPASDPSVGGKAIPGTSGLSWRNPA